MALFIQLMAAFDHHFIPPKTFGVPLPVIADSIWHRSW